MVVQTAALGLLLLWRERNRFAHVAQLVEHVLGKDEVTGSIPVMGSSEPDQQKRRDAVYLKRTSKWLRKHLNVISPT